MLLNYFPNSTISFRSNIFFHIGPLGVNCSFYKSKLACQSSCLPKSKRYIEIEAKFSLEVGRKAIPWKDATKAQERDDKKCKCFTSLAVVIIIIAAFLATALSALILAALFRESRIANREHNNNKAASERLERDHFLVAARSQLSRAMGPGWFAGSSMVEFEEAAGLIIILL